MKYYLTSIKYNVFGDDLPVTLAINPDTKKNEWSHPHETRREILYFETELAALLELRKMYPDRILTVLEDTGKIISTWAHESGITTMKIRRLYESV